MFEVKLTIPAAAFRQIRLAVKDLTVPLEAAGHYITESWMPELFKSKGKGTWRDSRRAPGGQPLVETGSLARGFFYAVDPAARRVRVTNIGKPPYVVRTLNYGATIKPKNGKWLVFSYGVRTRFGVSGKRLKGTKTRKATGWATVASVTIPPRPFMKWWPEMKEEAKNVTRRKLLQVMKGQA